MIYIIYHDIYIMSYADDSTLHVCSENVDVTLEILEEVGKVLFIVLKQFLKSKC